MEPSPTFLERIEGVILGLGSPRSRGKRRGHTIPSATRPRLRYLHLLILSCLYGVIILGLWLGLRGGTELWCFVTMQMLFLAAIGQIGAWTVLGPGTYLKRLFIVHLVAVPIVAGFVAGLFYEIYTSDDMTTVLLITLLCIPIVTVSAQIPFWLARGAFGWRICYKDQIETSSFQIKELFALTLVIAATCAIPQLLTQLYIKDALTDLVVGGTTYQLDETQSLYTTVEITQETIEPIIKRETEIAVQQSNGITLSLAIASFVSALIALPVFWRTMRGDSAVFGFAFTFLYGLAILSILSFGVLFTMKSYYFFNEFAVMFGFLLMAVIASWYPIYISRRTGFILISKGSPNNPAAALGNSELQLKEQQL